MGQRTWMGIYHHHRKIPLLSMQKEHPFITRKKFTHGLINSLKTNRAKRIREGEIYCIEYAPSGDFPTDKWHMISVVLVTEVNNRTVQGYNFLYLPSHVTKKITEQASGLKAFRESKLEFLLKEEMTQHPWICTLKEFQVSRILACSKIERDQWVHLPEMDKSPFGNLSAQLLQDDWKKENSIQEREKRKKKKDVLQESSEEQTFEVEENLNVREVVFEEAPKEESLRSLTDEIVDLDDDI